VKIIKNPSRFSTVMVTNVLPRFFNESQCIYTVSQKRYHPTTNDNFNNSCRIPIIFVQILLSKYAIERWFNIPPLLFIVRPYLGKDHENHNLSSKGAPFLRINKVTDILFVHNFCQSHALTINVQNVVHLHARTLSVAFSTR